MASKPPPSASSFLINLFGGLCYLAALWYYVTYSADPDEFLVPFIGITAAVVPIILLEILVLKVHKRAHLGIHKPGPVNKERSSVKLLGYYATIAIVLLLYNLIPGYDKNFYEYFHLFYMVMLIPVIVFGYLYIPDIDRRMDNPEDGLWQFGQLLCGHWRTIDRRAVFSYVKSVLLRFFFIPVMFTYFTDNATQMMGGTASMVHHEIVAAGYTQNIELIKAILTAYFFFCTLDVLFATIGYIFTFRVLDTHVRSTEPTLLGWIICIMCYYPFWELAVTPLLFSKLYSNPEWHVWLHNYPVLLTVWGIATVLAMCIESSTTLTFGLRFSNLTYRGLISTGGFRFTKHPQYVAKMLNRFLVFVPFLSLSGLLGVGQTMAMFCGVCFVYYLRARTEENHLSRYPEYVEYAEWINEHGIFRGLGRLFPFLRYSEEKARMGKLF